ALRLESLRSPDFFARLGVDRDQPSVQRSNVNLPIPRRYAAGRRTTAREPRPFRRNVRVVGPQLLARLSIVSGDDVVDADVVEHAVDDEGTRLDATHRFEVIVPSEAESLDIFVIDQVERAETLLTPIAAVA